MSEDRVRLASIGLGWWGSELATAAARTGRIDIVTCFARSVENREEFSAKHGSRTAGSLDELLADPGVEGVIVATSNQSHRSIIEQGWARAREATDDAERQRQAGEMLRRSRELADQKPPP